MTRRFDFSIKWNPDEETEQVLVERIIYALFVKRMRRNKPMVIFIGGDSGEGKSACALTLMDLILRVQGIDLLDVINDVNVYTPMQYPSKQKALLFDKRLKKVNVLCFHEAREVVTAKNWYDFLAQAVNSVNAMSRSIKRVTTIIISQFIRDITSDTRYSLNMYCRADRPDNYGARLWINILWKDDRDIEKPSLKKRLLRGRITLPDGSHRLYTPAYFNMAKPRKEIMEIFEKQDMEAKEEIIKRKLEKLMQKLEKDVGIESDKVLKMVEWYKENTDKLDEVGKVSIKGRFKLKPEFIARYELTDTDQKKFIAYIDVERKRKALERDKELMKRIDAFSADARLKNQKIIVDGVEQDAEQSVNIPS